MKHNPDVLGNGSGSDDRFAGHRSYRGAPRRDILGLSEQSLDGLVGGYGSHNGSAPTIDDMSTMPTMLEPPPVFAPTISINDLDSLSEPVFPPRGWLDEGPTGTLADHPLLRGLLMELPPRGTCPQPDWMDRWFEAARAILELIYMQHAHQGSRR